MSQAGHIESLLRQYAEWQNAPPADLWVNSGSKTEIIDGVSCVPDGGMARFVQTHQRQMMIERAARVVQDTLPFLPDLLRPVFDATYVGPAHLVPRSERDSAEKLGVSLNKYQKLKFGLLCFFHGANFQAMAVQLDKDVSTNRETKGSKRK